MSSRADFGFTKAWAKSMTLMCLSPLLLSLSFNAYSLEPGQEVSPDAFSDTVESLANDAADDVESINVDEEQSYDDSSDALAASTQDTSSTVRPTTPLNPNVNTNINAAAQCFASFDNVRGRVLHSNSQSVIVLSGANTFSPYITLQSQGDNGSHYVLWQTLNGEVSGYATKDGQGFDYVSSNLAPTPLSWHPTLVWDNLFASQKQLKNYSCVFVGRTRSMGKKASLLRLIPQEGLRYSYVIAKEDESDFPIELSVVDPQGNIVSRLTTIESRVVIGEDFPISDKTFENIALAQQGNNAKSAVSQSPAMTASTKATTSSIASKAENSTNDDASNGGSSPLGSAVSAANGNLNGSVSAGSGAVLEQGALSSKNGKAKSAASLVIWRELSIPQVYTLVEEGKYKSGGPHCTYQEFSDGITSFRVYKNKRSVISYPLLTNGSITIVRRNSTQNEYSVVGEIPVKLAEFVLSRIN